MSASESEPAVDRVRTTADALELFDSLPAVSVAEMLGRWAGREVPTGHPLDGLLGASGWYGKEFVDAESVHPLLFRDARGELFAADPRWMPLWMIGRVPPSVLRRGSALTPRLRPLLGTRSPRARLRTVEHRGVTTAAMVYDHLPIVDVFRRLDERTVLGAMDLKTEPRPFFFTLTHDSES